MSSYGTDAGAGIIPNKMDNVDPELGPRIKARLEQIGLTARQASLQAFGRPDAINEIINGRARSPTLETLRKLAAVLNWTIGQVTGEQPPDYQPVALDADILRTVIVRTEEYLKREGLSLPVNDRVSLYFAIHDAAAPEIRAGAEFNPARFAAFIKLVEGRASRT